MTHRAGADHGNGFNRLRTATWATHLAENRAHTPEATRFDYPNIRSYTIRSTEKAIVLVPNMHEKRTST
jgi:hypothetical protein